METCALHPRLDQDLLLTAAIVHDLGRTREFTLGAEIGLTDEGRLLGHVELGLRMLDERAGAAGLDDARRLALAHCVLTHHGADAAPARRFGSAEALALHRLNALDAGVKGGASSTGSASCASAGVGGAGRQGRGPGCLRQRRRPWRNRPPGRHSPDGRADARRRAVVPHPIGWAGV